MGLISESLNNQLNELVGKAFAINRMMDRGMSLLLVRWKLINTVKHLHAPVAHVFPGDLFADGISDYQSKRDMESIYPATPIGNREYSKPLDFFKDFLNECIEFEDMIKDAIDTSVKDEDITTKVFLDGILKNLVPFTALAQDLVDLFSMCNTPFELHVLDSEIGKYINI